jgi:LPXTG-motif cell wall-anchored protein
VPQFAALVAVAAGSALALGAGQPATAQLAPTAIQLGTASDYSVLGGQTVTNTGPTTVDGDLGVSPGSAVTGILPASVGGVIHADDADAADAQADLTTAYNEAAGRATTATVTADLGGQTLVGGVYTADAAGTLGLTGALTLDAQNDPNAVFVFQAASTLITASASSVNLVNGAQACNVFWQVGSSATLGTNTDFVGTIMALTTISVGTDAVIEGRALARNGEVTLDSNVFTRPGCLFSAATTTTAPPATTTPASTTPATTAPGTAPATTTPSAVTTVNAGATVPAQPIPTSPPADRDLPTTTFVFTPTDITLPSTGTGSLVTQSGVGFLVLVIGLAALVAARRRQPA